MRRVPRMPSKVAVDPAWSRLCTCKAGEGWRFLGGPEKCPSCGGRL